MINYIEIKSGKYILRGLHTKAENEKGLVVMFHGFTGHMNENGYFFKVLAEELAKVNVSSIRMDFMGSGMSDGHFDEMTFSTELEDARNILNHALEIKGDTPLYVLGFSCGGAVSAVMSREYKEKIAKLVLCAPAGNMDRLARARKINPAAIWYDEENIDMGGYLLNINFMDGFKNDNIDLYKDVETFQNPVLIVHGSNDQAVPIEFGRKYASLYPNCTFHEIEGSEHCFTRVPYRLRVNKLITEFLSK
ncbi:MAG: alpha/beta fold hydrolase [Bacilli bacterium]|nr:alpha/beta fold hydrolase [Bacilli bacterium]